MRDHARALGEPIIRAGLLAGATSRFVLVPLATSLHRPRAWPAPGTATAGHRLWPGVRRPRDWLGRCPRDDARRLATRRARRRFGTSWPRGSWSGARPD